MADDSKGASVGGLSTAAALALQNHSRRPGGDPPEQLDLLAELGLPQPPPMLANGHDPNGQDQSRRGRPAGVRNRRTEEWIDYFGKLGFRSPLERLMTVANLSAEQLARSVGCSKLEALQIIIKCSEAAAPYLHPRLATVEWRAPPRTLAVEGELADLVDVTPDRAEDDTP